jgi:hypothetical protein
MENNPTNRVFFCDLRQIIGVGADLFSINLKNYILPPAAVVAAQSLLPALRVLHPSPSVAPAHELDAQPQTPQKMDTWKFCHDIEYNKVCRSLLNFVSSVGCSYVSLRCSSIEMTGKIESYKAVAGNQAWMKVQKWMMEITRERRIIHLYISWGLRQVPH